MRIRCWYNAASMAEVVHAARMALHVAKILYWTGEAPAPAKMPMVNVLLGMIVVKVTTLWR